MKKVISVLLAAAATLVMSMTAFAGDDAAAVLDQMTAKSNAMDSMDAHVDMNLVISVPGAEPIDMSMAMNMKMSQIQSGNLLYKAEIATAAMGQTTFQTLFYKGGMYYMDMDGVKIAYPMDLDTMMKSAMSYSGVSDMTSSMMKELSLKEENGEMVLSYTADENQMNSYLQQVMGAMASQLGQTGTMNIREVKGTYVLNQDGFYDQMTMTMVMDMTMSGQTATVSMVMSGVLNQPGQPVTVDIPSTAGYMDMETYMNTLVASGNAA